MMKTVLLIVAGVISTSWCCLGGTPDSISINLTLLSAAKYSDKGEASTEGIRYIVRARVTNHGDDEVNLAVEDLDHFRYDVRKGSKYSTKIRLCDDTTLDGTRIVIPASRLGVVTLKKGEIAEFLYNWSLPVFIPEISQIELTYSIDESFADRYHLWRGTVSSELVVLAKPANKTPEPTTPSVTPAADAPAAPAGVAAQL